MIKRLKLKFILTTMVLTTIILFLAFLFIYFSNKSNIEESCLEAMREVTESKHNSLGGLFDKEPAPKRKYPQFTTYSIQVDLYTNTCYIEGYGDSQQLTSDDTDYINTIVNTVLNSDSNIGILDEFDMRFMRSESPIGKKIVLLDRAYEITTLQSLLTTLMIIGISCFFLLLVISVIMAHTAVKPIEKSIIQQKQLISDMSHELKTPITVIGTNTDIILSHENSTVENERKWLGYIKDETSRMSEMINMMLFLAKNDEETNHIQLSEFNFSNAVYEVSLPFESVCFEKNKELSINIEDDIYIKADEASIKQLLVILLDNAVKYSSENGRITLVLKTVADKIVLSVNNSGEPIPKESIPLIFDRFYRVDRARSRESGGSGLGLSIAKQIIYNNDASISVHSDEQHGTTFTCIFKTIKQKKKDKTDTSHSFS